MSKDLNIDELLNGYIDGELSTRQTVELKRLINHDPEITKKLQRLQRTKKIISALPKVTAPAHIFKDVKLRLGEKIPVSEPLPAFSQRPEEKKALPVFYKRVLAAAAVIALLAGVIGIVSTMIAPQDTAQMPVVLDDVPPPEQPMSESIQPVDPVVLARRTDAPDTFNGKIILTTDSLLPLDAFLNRTIVELGLLPITEIYSEKNRSVFDIHCRYDQAKTLLAQLGTVWHKCESKTLYLYKEQFPDYVTVENVSPQQILQIADLNTLDEQIKVAGQFNTLNNVESSLTDRSLMAALNQQRFSFSIPRSFLTSVQVPPDEQQSEKQNQPKNIYLTIVIRDRK